MKRVFLDTNILLDIIEGRDHQLLASLNIFEMGVRGAIQLYASPLTFANCLYVARRNVGTEKALEGLRRMKRYVMATTMDDAQCMAALYADMPDFEDMLQYESAMASQCDVIITRNKKHFPTEGLLVLFPQEYLEQIA
ncbi:MAG: PIN domain-containing protein [Prevotella sp.]|nr:PIN domain-containing protein [Prevotella sp.]